MYRFEDLHVPCDWFLVPTEAAGDMSIVGWQVSAQNKMSPRITPSSASYLTSILHSSFLRAPSADAADGGGYKDAQAAAQRQSSFVRRPEGDQTL